MKQFLPLILLFFWSFGTRADICESVFKTSKSVERSFDIKSIDRINRLEGWSKRLRVLAYKDDPLAPSAARKSLKLFKRVESGLLSGNSADGIQAYKLLFRKIEGSSLIIERYEALARALKQIKGASNIEESLLASGVSDILAKEYGALLRAGDVNQLEKKVQKILRKRYRKLGRDFSSYNHAQQSLLRLKSADYCSPQCKQAIDELHENIGLSSDSRMFGALVGARKSYSLSEVRELFNSHPSAVLAARKKEFIQEGVAVLSKYIKKFKVFQGLIEKLANSRYVKNKKVIRLFKGVFDARYFDVDHAGILRVSKSDFSKTKKLALAQEQSADIDQSLFFMNFSRGTDGDIQKAWEEIKQAAQMTDSKLYKRLLAAQEVGKRLGPPSKQNLTRAFQILAGVGLAGAGWAYFNYDLENDRPEDLRSESDEAIYQLDQIDKNLPDAEAEGNEFQIEYLGKDDAQVTDSLALALELERELGKDSAPNSQD